MQDNHTVNIDGISAGRALSDPEWEPNICKLLVTVDGSRLDYTYAVQTFNGICLAIGYMATRYTGK